MSSPDAEWWSAQAAEYVLGTLSNDDHRLFERMLVNDADVRRLVVRWERRLQPLADTIAPVEPPPELFRRVREAVLEGSENARVVDPPVADPSVVDARRVEASGTDPRADERADELRPLRDRPRGFADTDREPDRTADRQPDRRTARQPERDAPRRPDRDAPRRPGRDAPRGARSRAPRDVADRAPDSLLLQRLRRWRWAFAGSSMLAGGLAAGLAAVLLVPGLGAGALDGRFGGDDTLATASPVLPAFGGVASRVGLSLLSDTDGTPRYLVEVDDASGQVRIVSLGAPPTPSGRSFELWVADGQSGALRSVGLLPDEGWNGRIVDAFGDGVRDPAFAVSVEPEGGSPADGPTGEVVFQGIIHPVDVEVGDLPGVPGPDGAGADGTAPEGRERGR